MHDPQAVDTALEGASTPTSPAPTYEQILETGDAVGILPVEGRNPITVIGCPEIRRTFDDRCLQQARNSSAAPGVAQLVLNPDAHFGYGAPVGCVLASPSHLYPGPVGVDIKCSMSLLQLDLPAEAVVGKRERRALINAVLERVPTGAGRGQRHAPKARPVDLDLGRRIVTQGASPEVCDALGIPRGWAERCEDARHVGHDHSVDALALRLERLLGGQTKRFAGKMRQLGSYGGGNHFGECEVVRVADGEDATAQVFGLRDGHVAFLSHCGSRGFGHDLAVGQFRSLRSKFEAWNIPLPGNDRELVYAPLGSPEADAYLDDMALGANFATVNHLLINALVLEAFQQVIPGIRGHLVYFISHNIARREIVGNTPMWVHRKGATRAFPAGHHALAETPFAATGHPILLPGDPQRGSAVMVAEAGAERSCFSVNHGAGRRLGRKHAKRILDQKTVDRSFDDQDILTNCRAYPRDEAPEVYKDFDLVLGSVKRAGLAREVARLDARFVIKDASKADD
ncbi:MAG: RtcB family protein [Acidobacteriota bacterium]